tara:strand:- start:240 stop:1607 length:1368 start_codon:yes stop_codon:yes gene_type:complete
LRAIGFFSRLYRNTNIDRVNINYSEYIKNYCATNNHSLVKIFSPENNFYETESHLDERYRLLLNYFKNPIIKRSLILIPKSSHLAPNLETFIYRFIELYEMDLKILCIDSDKIDPLQNAEKYLTLSGRDISDLQNKRKTIVSKAARGMVLGKIPYGYTKSVDGDLIIDQNEAKLVIDIFDLYTNFYPGINEPYGLRKIAQFLNDNNFRTRNGNLWNAVSLLAIIKNKVYIGNYDRYGIQIPNNHKAIIEIDKFNQAQDVLNSRSPKKRTKPFMKSFPLHGLVKCYLCDQKLNGLTRKQSWKNKEGRLNTNQYRYYTCPKRRIRKNKSFNKHVQWRSEKLEKTVLYEINKLPKSKRKKISFIIPNYYKDLYDLESSFIRNIRISNRKFHGMQDIKSSLDKLLSFRRKKIELIKEQDKLKSDVLNEIYDNNKIFSIEYLHFIKIEILAHENFISLNI